MINDYICSSYCDAWTTCFWGVTLTICFGVKEGSSFNKKVTYAISINIKCYTIFSFWQQQVFLSERCTHPHTPKKLDWKKAIKVLLQWCVLAINTPVLLSMKHYFLTISILRQGLSHFFFFCTNSYFLKLLATKPSS